MITYNKPFITISVDYFLEGKPPHQVKRTHTLTSINTKI